VTAKNRKANIHKLFDAKRIKEVEKELSEFDETGEVKEGLYRSYHGSFKIILNRQEDPIHKGGDELPPCFSLNI